MLIYRGSLAERRFERRASTGSGPFACLASCFAQAANRGVKALADTNLVASRHTKRAGKGLTSGLHGRSKTPLLKLPIILLPLHVINVNWKK